MFSRTGCCNDSRQCHAKDVILILHGYIGLERIRCMLNWLTADLNCVKHFRQVACESHGLHYLVPEKCDWTKISFQ